MIKFVNFLNFVLNWLLKPKKEIKSNMTMYLWNSFINDIVEILRIISQGKTESLKYLSEKPVIG